jgi:predicted alpha-1,2-mannosidase
MLLLAWVFASAQGVTQYVDPYIGIKGGGNVAIGPSAPYGMVKPGPDCSRKEASGWRPLNEGCFGFSQVHNSGTGGGAKYGNILIQPFSGQLDATEHRQLRTEEEARLGYYQCRYEDASDAGADGPGAGAITTEITAAARGTFYRFTYEGNGPRCLSVDCGWLLGGENRNYPKEGQYLVGSEVRILSDHEVEGYTRANGGWNGGRAYTVYFYLVTDRPFTATRTWKGDRITDARWQYDSGEATGALLRFTDGAGVVNVKVGISNIGCLRARQNVEEQLPQDSLEEARAALTAEWESLLGRVEIAPETPDSLKRMFYTALYHTYLHPVDKTGENPLWTGSEPYFDDYYAIWDTFRTSLPLMMLLTPSRASDFCRSLIDTYRHDHYLPDGRSGHCNGRTQGGSNADIVLADAFLRGLPGIDWKTALEACLKDADVPPGDDEEAEGRGGLAAYNTLGYVPYGIPRAGTRTLEYARCDYAIYLLIKGMKEAGYDGAELGCDLDSLARRFLRQSGNWRNLWRSDFESNGFRGFIMPRDRSGRWLDSIPAYPSKVYGSKLYAGGALTTAGTAWARAGDDWTVSVGGWSAGLKAGAGPVGPGAGGSSDAARAGGSSDAAGAGAGGAAGTSANAAASVPSGPDAGAVGAAGTSAGAATSVPSGPDAGAGWPFMPYTPVTREPGTFCTNWEMFFYEGTGWIYSLSVPHDVPGLIEACGGPDIFKARLDEFLYAGYFSTNNEPAFFAPCLYHWIGRPDLTGEIVRTTVFKEFNDGWKGLPGNDDTGATSAWLLWHLMGLYPVAGQDLYILHAPLLPEVTLHLDPAVPSASFMNSVSAAAHDGASVSEAAGRASGTVAALSPASRDLVIRAEGLSDTNRFIQSVTLNGRNYPYSSLHHADLASGGLLVLKMGPAPSSWGRSLAP